MAPAEAIGGLVGLRRWLRDRNRVRYVREGTMRQVFSTAGDPRRIERVELDVHVPADTSVKCRVRTRTASGPWSQWQDPSAADRLPAGTEAQVEVVLHTDDGYVTPRVGRVGLSWK